MRSKIVWHAAESPKCGGNDTGPEIFNWIKREMSPARYAAISAFRAERHTAAPDSIDGQSGRTVGSFHAVNASSCTEVRRAPVGNFHFLGDGVVTREEWTSVDHTAATNNSIMKLAVALCVFPDVTDIYLKGLSLI